MNATLDKKQVPRGFDGVAESYDRMTALNPGYHKHLRWSAERMGLAPTARVLDLCCGTGLSTAALAAVYPRTRITGLDASPRMLAIARRKPALRHVDLICGDAMDPGAAGACGPYDGVLMAYGIRNVPDADACLASLHTILAPGGVVCFHEYSVRDSRLARATWNAVATGVILPTALAFDTAARRRPARRRPRAGDLFRYLRQSVNDFDGARAFADRLGRAGFVDVQTAPMDGWQRGIVHSFLARRPC